ncbi:LOW QUALITY PROTEIN: pyroglutamylated RF-amide peptide receptor-like [Dreissena polymorpha]|uniref:LOW QUALITY PROTEIN: pyroglutamylated RF-amide peptide receptor-like n=1 Tax=Dreissena polymorpha TaxID=45954 RepID=UPI002264CB6E|nr:LOW QUALITY PROTEIN: pyroglutamylated RF-amide peptide receptor-like [Dreissena polymorpha]
MISFAPWHVNSTNATTDANDYDYEILYSPPLQELVPMSLSYGATLLLGIIGNGLVILSVSRFEQMMTITNTFLLSLASADLLLVLICVPIKFATFFSYHWRFGAFMCKTIHYIQNVSAICSVATLTVMSLERYYAIVHPMKAKYVCTKGRARRCICALWFASFILGVPILIGRIQIQVGRHGQAYWCVKWFSTPFLRILYEGYMFGLILVLPVIIMSFAYIRVCQELWFMAKHRSTMRADADTRRNQFYERNGSTNSTPLRMSSTEKTPVLRVKFTDDDSTKKQVIKMLVAVVVVFIICWAPILTNDLLVALEILPELNIPPYKYMRETFHLMSYINSCVNPIVYGFMSRNFRQMFKRALCGCLKGRQYEEVLLTGSGA